MWQHICCSLKNELRISELGGGHLGASEGQSPDRHRNWTDEVTGGSSSTSWLSFLKPVAVQHLTDGLGPGCTIVLFNSHTINTTA